jgi:protein tyrosine phosphatase (PTP) superfamily phosphohydrolase (DUF442 family)
MVGFFSGTLVLLEPVQWLSSHARQAGWPQGRENGLVMAIIALYVGGSALVTACIIGVVRRARLAVRVAAFAVCTAAAAGTLALWLSPKHMAQFGHSEIVTVGRFVFGPYPEEDRLRQLRQEGYAAVVSLLHEAVVPFEPVLLDRERKGAEAAGIPVVHIPMLPWVSGNEESLERIGELARGGEGRYYVHCYLGRDRVNLVRRFVERETGKSASGRGQARSLRQAGDFERGKIVELDDEVFLVPYPTDEEWMGYLLSGRVRHVASLLDPSWPEDVPWIEREERLLNQHGVSYIHSPISSAHYEPEQVMRAVKRVRALARPVAVHAFLGDSPVTRAFATAWRTGRPPAELAETGSNPGGKEQSGSGVVD